MRVKVLYIILWMQSFCLLAFAQTKSLDNIIAALNNAEVIKNCAEFKKDISDKVLKLKFMQNIDVAKFTDLRLAYTDVYEKYDAFLKSIKSDLSNIENLKNLVRDPETTAQNYATAYQQVKDAYENNFLQQFNTLQTSDAKGIPFLVLLKFGVSAFKVIVNSIKNHKIDKEGTINLTLPAINEKIFNKLRINTWSEYKLAEPVGYKTEEAIIIPHRTINSLHGIVAFFQKDNSGEDLPILFMNNEGKKDLQVITDNENEQVLTIDEYFSTVKKFEIGSQLRLEVNNSGFTYILALNSNGIALLYPERNQATNTIDSKDITTLSDETPATGQVFIPQKGMNGQPRYFTITKNASGIESKAEELAILLSKSEFGLNEIVEKLNEVGGTLSERIAQVFGEKKIDKENGNVSLETNQISFNADDSDRDILPLVFKILKK